MKQLFFALLGAVVFWSLPIRSAPTQPLPRREMAVTFDDLPGVFAASGGEISRLREATEKLVRSIVAQGIPADGFVNEGKLAPQGVPNPERIALLRTWVDAGLELGNHTYSHLDLNGVPLERF